MPLSPPVARQHLHTRTVTCQGFRRDDGLWDIEGHMTDIKTYDFPNRDRGGAIKAGEPIHEMWVRVTLDDDLVIQDIEVRTDHAPFTICPDITPVFDELKGIGMSRGFLREVRQRFSGRNGCTHIVELFAPMATAAFQTIVPLLRRERGANQRPGIIDTCHALAADGDVVKAEWPQWWEGKEEQTA